MERNQPMTDKTVVVPVEPTDSEIVRDFLHMARTMKPVGHWPNETVCAAIERLIAAPTPPAGQAQTVGVLVEQTRETLWREWGIDGMPKDKQRLADAAFKAGLAAAPTPPAGQGEWLPIETAPKDGTLFLGWVSAVRYGEDDAGQPFEHDVSDYDFCRWREMETGGFYENMMGQIGDAQDITHWMPLPAAPSSEAAAA